MFHCLQIYIFVTDNRQFQYFTFLPHDVEIFVKFTFLPLRWLLHWLCIYIAVSIFFCVFTFLPYDVEFFVKFTFLPLVITLIVHLHFCRLFCIAYKFSFLLFAVALHFAACFCVAYSFFLFCKFAFCRLLLHCLRIYIFVAHYCILFEQTIDYITEATRQEYVRTT